MPVPSVATARVRGHAARFGWRLTVIDAGEFADPRYRANPVNRCYFCKTNLYGVIAARFDGTILSCIDLADGTRKWKGGRYGGGQMVLIADQDILLVVSEEGELVLVGATSDQFKELGRAPGLNGKTWNHPVVAGGLLFVRNAEEMAAFRLRR